MIKKITILTLLLASTNFIDAHCGGCGVGDKKDHGKKEHHKQVEQLNLSSDQKEKHKAITEKHKKEMKSLKEKYRLEINSILNNDQREIFKKQSYEKSELCNHK